MKQYLKLMLSLLVAGQLTQASLSDRRPSAEKIIEWAKNGNAREILNCLNEGHRSDDSGKLWYRHPLAHENITGKNFERSLDYSSMSSTRDTKHITLGPNYSVVDLVVKYGTPKTMQEIINNCPFIDELLNPDVNWHLDEFKHMGDGSIEYETSYSHKKASNGDPAAFGEMLFNNNFHSNPLITAATDGRLDMVEILVKELTRGAAEVDLPSRLNISGANFIRPGVFFFDANALLCALIKKHYDVAQYLLDQGALPVGTSYGTRAAFVLDMNKASFQLKPEPIDIQKLIRDAKLTVKKGVATLLDKNEDNSWNYGLDKKVSPLLERFNKQIKNGEVALLGIIKEALETLDEKQLKHFIAVAKNNLKMEESSGFIEQDMGQRLITWLGMAKKDPATVIFTISLRLRGGYAVITYLEQHKDKVNTPIDTGEGFGAKPPVFYFGNQLDVVKELEKLGANLHFGDGNEFLKCSVSSCSLPVTEYLVNKRNFKVTPEHITLAQENRCPAELIHVLNAIDPWRLEFVNAIRNGESLTVLDLLRKRPDQINVPIDIGEGFGAEPPIFYFADDQWLIDQFAEIPGVNLHFENDKLMDKAVKSCNFASTYNLSQNHGFKTTPKHIALAEKSGCTPGFVSRLKDYFAK